MTAPELSPEAVETLAEEIHRSRCGCQRGPHDGHKDVALALAPTVAALIAQHVEAARADEAQRVRERVEAVHWRYFDQDGTPGEDDTNPAPEDVWRYDRDLRAALATPDPEAAGPRLTEGCKCGKYTTGWLGDRNALNVDGEHHGSKACDV